MSASRNGIRTDSHPVTARWQPSGALRQSKYSSMSASRTYMCTLQAYSRSLTWNMTAPHARSVLELLPYSVAGLESCRIHAIIGRPLYFAASNCCLLYLARKLPGGLPVDSAVTIGSSRRLALEGVRGWNEVVQGRRPGKGTGRWLRALNDVLSLRNGNPQLDACLEHGFDRAEGVILVAAGEAGSAHEGVRPIMCARQLTQPSLRIPMFDFPATETNLSNFVDSRSIAESGSPEFIDTHLEHPRVTPPAVLTHHPKPGHARLAHPVEIRCFQNEYNADYSTQSRSVYHSRVAARHLEAPTLFDRASSLFCPGRVEEV